MNKHTHTNKRRLTEIFFEIGVRVNKKNNKIKKEVRCHSDKKNSNWSNNSKNTITLLERKGKDV